MENYDMEKDKEQFWVENVNRINNLNEDDINKIIIQARQKMKEKHKSLKAAEIVAITRRLNYSDFYLVKKVIREGTNRSYRAKPMKHHACVSPGRRNSIGPLKKLLREYHPVKHIIYIYMNTGLRERVFIDDLIDEMMLSGYNKSEILNAIGEYWILGKIQQITDEGLVSVLPISISSTKPMTFNSNSMHIKNKEGEFVSPQVDSMIYCKIQYYFDEEHFCIHNLCKKDEN